MVFTLEEPFSEFSKLLILQVLIVLVVKQNGAISGSNALWEIEAYFSEVFSISTIK